jgi:HEAT repeat protein
VPLRALGHRHDEVRVHAAVALSDLRATEAVDPLIRLLDGAGPRGRAPSKKLRETAVGALGV